jgi:GDP/UDP-N,N'-diacetylbacillosamine 2-epimerase (hydrolysing)
VIIKRKIKNILFITGSRGEWGYIRPILRLIQKDSDLDYKLCVTNMHLLPSYGSPIDEIINDGFDVHFKPFMALDGYNHFSTVKSLGILISSISDYLYSNPPDWIVLAGDRGEQLAGAIAGAYCYIPVAHIQAGELSGNIDGVTRHAIGKYAHVHFASNKDASERLIKLGEQDFRVHNVGAPQIDEMIESKIPSIDSLKKKYSLPINDEYLLFVQHGVTEDYQNVSSQIDISIKSLIKINMPVVVILPNNDAGSYIITSSIEKSRTNLFYCYKNLPREDYLGFLNHSKAIVGNSSSGLLEAPTFKVPAVNIGRRQNMRVRGENVIDCDFKIKNIVSSIQKAMSTEFNAYLIGNCLNPYGDGKSSKRIIEIIKNTKIDDRLLTKLLTY